MRHGATIPGRHWQACTARLQCTFSCDRCVRAPVTISGTLCGCSSQGRHHGKAGERFALPLCEPRVHQDGETCNGKM